VIVLDSLLDAINALPKPAAKLLKAYFKFMGIDWDKFVVLCKENILPNSVAQEHPILILLWAATNVLEDSAFAEPVLVFTSSKCAYDCIGDRK
jgi:hypothetical protein